MSTPLYGLFGVGWLHSHLLPNGGAKQTNQHKCYVYVLQTTMCTCISTDSVGVSSEEREIPYHIYLLKSVEVD